ncbi:MAG: radical SAM protein [Myxococcales bacterium]|nr:radical SAM protein [Myxococcales bacterium]
MAPPPRRRIVLASIDPWRGEGDFRPFDYGLRRIAAAIAGSELASADWEVHLLSRRDEDVDALVAAVRELEPDVVGVSAYVWSLGPFLEAAAILKGDPRPPVVLVGGPSARPGSFARDPLRALGRHVDALVLGDGEETILDVLSLPQLDRASLASIPGVATFGPLGWRGMRRAARLPLDALPSPYQLGLVPREATAHLEIFRGCPLSCTFCQWGRYDGERAASADHLERELSAIGRMGARGVFLVDAGLNLSARAFRALAEAERRVGLLAKVGLNCELYPSYVRSEHLELLSRARSHVGIGIQSLDPVVLAGLDRPVTDLARMKGVIEDVARVADVLLEVILGLPGDSPDGFRRTLDWARSFGCSVNVYHCLVLPDALLDRAVADDAFDYDPVTFALRRAPGWTEDALAKTAARLDQETANARGMALAGTWHLPRP